MRKTLLMTLVVVATAATAAAPAASEPQAAAGSLDLKVRFGVISPPFPCPAGVPSGANECRARTGNATVPGLGLVTQTYTWPMGVGPPTCATDFAKALPTTGRLVVHGKGAITFTLAEGPRCVGYGTGPPEPQNEPQVLTITGGTGPFATASGSGKLDARALFGGAGTETLTGTLKVTGLEFDLTPPKLNGATPKTVRVAKGAKSARVTFKVTATDDVDGAVPVSCQPRSGSRFKVGRTTARCEATDSSGNSAKAAFAVTVKPRR